MGANGMALITRLSRLFEADFHAVLDRIEEPELQLKQAVREMRFALEQNRQRHKLLQHEAEQLDKASAETAASIEGFDQELDICLAAKKDDLARDLVRRKLAAGKHLQALRQQAETISAQRDELDGELEEQVQMLDSMQQKLDLLATRETPAGGTAFESSPTIRNEEIEIALLREKQRRAEA
jgi:phage shock protein A